MDRGLACDSGYIYASPPKSLLFFYIHPQASIVYTFYCLELWSFGYLDISSFTSLRHGIHSQVSIPLLFPCLISFAPCIPFVLKDPHNCPLSVCIAICQDEVP